MEFTFDNNMFDDSIIGKSIEKYGNRIKIASTTKPMISLKISSNKEQIILKEVKDFLEQWCKTIEKIYKIL